MWSAMPRKDGLAARETYLPRVASREGKNETFSWVHAPIGVKCMTKGLFSDWIAVRPTAARRRYRGCVAMQCRLAAALTTYQ